MTPALHVSIVPTRELSLMFSHVFQHELVGVCDDESVAKHLNYGADVTVGWPVELRSVRRAVQIMVIFISSIGPFQQHRGSWRCTVLLL